MTNKEYHNKTFDTVVKGYDRGAYHSTCEKRIKKFIDLGRDVSCNNCANYIELESGGKKCEVFWSICDNDFPCIHCIGCTLQDYIEKEK